MYNISKVGLFSLSLVTILSNCSDTEFAEDRNKSKRQDSSQQQGANPSGADGKENSHFKGGKNDEVIDNAGGGKNEITVDEKLKKGTLKFTCEESSPIKKSVEGKLGDQINLVGQLCFTQKPPEVQQSLNVLFIIDISGSMQTNDPTKNSTCGRHKAVNAIVAKIRSSVPQNSLVNIGIVGFSSGAYTMMAMQKLTSNLTFPVDKVCAQYGMTNYDLAFVTANTMLKSVNGSKAVYFISDGVPTESSQGASKAQELGITSAAKFRNDNQNLKLYSVFLGSDGLNANFKPEEYLAKISGDAKNVKLVAVADQLAPEVEKFELPPVNASASSPEVLLSLSDGNFKKIAVTDFKKITDLKWEFTTEYFSLHGKSGETTENTLMIKANFDQSPQEHRLSIDFKAQ